MHHEDELQVQIDREARLDGVPPLERHAAGLQHVGGRDDAEYHLREEKEVVQVLDPERLPARRLDGWGRRAAVVTMARSFVAGMQHEFAQLVRTAGLGRAARAEAHARRDVEQDKEGEREEEERADVEVGLCAAEGGNNGRS